MRLHSICSLFPLLASSSIRLFTRKCFASERETSERETGETHSELAGGDQKNGEKLSGGLVMCDPQRRASSMWRRRPGIGAPGDRMGDWGSRSGCGCLRSAHKVLALLLFHYYRQIIC